MLEIITDTKLLKRKSKRVAKIDDTIRNLCISLEKTMIASNGIGIAAPQCNILKRVIVVNTDKGIKYLINPEIISESNETEICEEGCLSVPGKFFKKERPITVTVKYRSMKGVPTVETFSGLNARVVSHEIDHLNGIILEENYDENS
jgi:peptide deformylase